MLKKKILILVSDISKSGGTERASVNLANMLCDTYDIEILSVHNGKGAASYFEINKSVKLTNFDLTVESPIKNFFNNYKLLKNYLKRKEIDFIFGMWYGISTVLPLIKSKKTKVIACEHADFNANSFSVKILARLLYPKLDAVVVLSDLARKKLNKYNKVVSVIPNCLPFATDSTSTLQQKRILMVGRFVAVKGYERIFPLAHHLQQHHKDWVIEIFGDGDLKDFFADRLVNENLNNVILNSAVSNIKDKYLNSSIYLSTSYNEAMPMVFLEAMSCGLPIISYVNEGSEYLIQNGYNGYLINSPQELVENCDRLINSIDLREQIGQNGLTMSLDFSESNVKRIWVDFLNTIKK